MEKLTLFDLIGKFGEAAKSGRSFSRPQSRDGGDIPAGEKREKTGGNAGEPGGEIRRKNPGNGESAERASVFVDPGIPSPPVYRMNGKMTAFCKRHDELSAGISAANDGKRRKGSKPGAAKPRHAEKKSPSRQAGKGE